MWPSMNKSHDETKWKINISTRMRRVEFIICIQVLLFSVNLLDKYWTNTHIFIPQATSFSAGEIKKDTPIIKHRNDDIALPNTNNNVALLERSVTPSRSRVKYTSMNPDCTETTKTAFEGRLAPPWKLPRKLNHDNDIGVELSNSDHLTSRNLQSDVFVQSEATPDESNEPHENLMFSEGNESLFGLPENSLNNRTDHNHPRNHCDAKLNLSPINSISNYTYDDRVAKILDELYSITTLEQINIPSNPAYKAACWLLYDDDLKIEPGDRFLTQRFVLAVFLFSIGWHPDKIHQLSPITCDFDKIKCNGDGHITEINITNDTSVRGTLPRELALLQDLEFLYLQNNSIAGTVPTEFGSFKNLKQLLLEGNQLTGTVPSQLGRLINLLELKLGTNKLVGTMPSEIGLLQNLVELDLDINDMTGTIPDEIYNCSSLVLLDLQNNHFNGTISSKIGHLVNLKIILLRKNRFSGSIPSEVGNLVLTEIVFIDNNQLTGSLPHEISNWASLGQVIFNNNHLTGHLPDVFDNFQELKGFSISMNDFIGPIPDSLWNLNHTQGLIINGNEMTGTVPDDVCDSKVNFNVDNSPWFRDESKVKCSCCGNGSCYMWDVSHPTAAGTVRPRCPEFNIQPIEFIEDFWLTDRISNETINEFGDFKVADTKNICLSPTGCYILFDESSIIQANYSYSANLKHKEQRNECDAVDINGTLITEDHPKRIGLNHLTQLVVQDFSRIDEESHVYKTLCWIINEDPLFDSYSVCDGTLLQRFVLACFFFNQRKSLDEISKNSTCDWPGITCDEKNKYVEHLHFDSSEFQGTLITEIGFLSRLKNIDLSNNKFRGSIDPMMFSHMPFLEYFNVSFNRFSGDLPKPLLSLEKLEVIDVSDNIFVGQLPNDIVYSTELREANFSSNMIQGSIPSALFMCTNLEYLNLSRNSFSNKIPSEISKLQKLKGLLLKENKLTGSIPSHIFDLPKLSVLFLQSNHLTGSIPTEIGNLDQVRFIILNHNSLEGTIPSELANLSQIEWLYLHHNQLTGTAPDMKSIKENKQNFTFITDCGNPNFLLDRPLTCEGCTICCNSLDQCQDNISFGVMKLQVLAFLGVVSLVIIIILVHALLVKARRSRLISRHGDHRSLLSIYNEDSVYSLVFSSDRVAWGIYLGTLLVQFSMFSVFLIKSNFDNEDTDWVYTMRCPDNNLTCSNAARKTRWGWFLFFVITYLSTASDLMDSSHQLRKAVKLRDVQLLISGFFLFSLTAMAFVTTFIYNIALAVNDTDLLVNAVILMFIVDLDEQFLKVLEAIAPHWIKERLEEIEENLESKGKSLNGDNSQREDPQKILHQEIHKLRSNRFLTDGSYSHRDSDRHFQLQIILKKNDASETHLLEDYVRNTVEEAFKKTSKASISVEYVGESLNSTETMDELPMAKTDNKSSMDDDDCNPSANVNVDDRKEHVHLQIISEENDATETHSLEDYARNTVEDTLESTPNGSISVEYVGENLNSTETMDELPITNTDDKSSMDDDGSNLSANGSFDDHKEHDL